MDISSIIVTALAVLGTIRVVFIPIVGAINIAIAKSPSKSDDEKWKKIKNSWWFLLFQGLLDLTAGLKIGRKVLPTKDS